MSATREHDMSGHVPVMLAEVLDDARPARRRAAIWTARSAAAAMPAPSSAAPPARCGRSTATPPPSRAARRWPPAIPAGCTCCTGSSATCCRCCARAGVTRLDGVVLDLGVSSFQIDDPARGFSFRADGPLDMRMERDGPTAADLVNALPEQELADTLFRFGEERLSRRIARAIVAARAAAPITTTARLAAIIRAVVPPERSGIDPATRSFQALRMRVNDELGEIERALRGAVALLDAGRAAGGGGVPLAGRPAGEAVHDRGHRPRAGAVAPRPRRPGGRARPPNSAC